MARQKDGINRSQAIRDLLSRNPDLPVKEVLSTLAAEGIKVHANLVYFIKGKLRGRKGRRRKTRQAAVSAVASATTNGDALSTILRVKKLAAEVGGLKKLKALVEALTE